MNSALQLDWGLDALRLQLGPGVELQAVASCGSTNTELLEACRAGLARPRLLLAETQTAGRGRQGRSWQSWPGSSLTLSLAWPWKGAPLDGLSLAVGAALAEALEPDARTLQLKWPNDLWLQRRKLGGILIESVSQGGAPRALVIGVGLNLEAPPQPSELPLAWLRELDPRWSAPLALATTAPALVQLLQDWPQQGLAAWAPVFARRDGLQGLSLSAGGHHGQACGIGPGGELLLRDDAGRLQSIMAGEATVKFDSP